MKCYGLACILLATAVIAENKQKRSKDEILAQLEHTLDNIDKMMDGHGAIGVASTEHKVEGMCPAQNFETETCGIADESFKSAEEDSVEEVIEEPVVEQQPAVGIFGRLRNLFW